MFRYGFCDATKLQKKIYILTGKQTIKKVRHSITSLQSHKSEKVKG